MLTTKQYAEKLLTSIPTYAAAVTNKNKFLKFPMKHHDKNLKYVFDECTFPKLKNPPTTTTNTNMDTNTTTTTNSNSDTNAAAVKNTGESKSKIDL